MAPKTQTVATGGGSAAPLGDDFVAFLRKLVTGGGQPGSDARFGQADPMGKTSEIEAAITRLLSPESSGNFDLSSTSDALTKVIQTETDRGAADIRARYGASGGTSLGTPGAVAEGIFRSDSAPKIASVLGELGLKAETLKQQGRQSQGSLLASIIASIADISKTGYAPARNDVIVGKNSGLSAIDALAGLISAAGTAYGAYKSGRGSSKTPTYRALPAGVPYLGTYDPATGRFA